MMLHPGNELGIGALFCQCHFIKAQSLQIIGPKDITIGSIQRIDAAVAACKDLVAVDQYTYIGAPRSAQDPFPQFGPPQLFAVACFDSRYIPVATDDQHICLHTLCFKIVQI